MAGAASASILVHMGLGWFAPLTYKAYSSSTGADKFWGARAAVSAPALVPLIPAQLPGPMDAWAGPGPKRIILRAPGSSAVALNLLFRDVHDSAPPMVRIMAGETLAVQFRAPKGKGAFAGEDSHEAPMFTRQVFIPAKVLAASGRSVSISLADGSWVAFHSIEFKTTPPWWEAALALLAAALTLYLCFPQVKVVESAQERSGGISWTLAGAASLAGAIMLPGSHFGLFDGLPLASLEETLAMMVALPALVVLGAGFFRSPRPGQAAMALLAIKLGLYIWAPVGGMALRVFGAPERAASGAWERTYDTLIHPGMSAKVTHPLAGGSQFPVDWLWRRDSRFTTFSYPLKNRPSPPHGGGQWIAAQVEAWVDVPADRRLVFLTVGAGSGAITATSLDGRKIELRPAHALAGAGLALNQMAPPGVWKISGSFTFSQEAEREYALAPVLLKPDGDYEDAFAAGAVWMDRGSALVGWAGRWMAWAGAMLEDLGICALLAWWAVWTIGRMLAAGEASPALLAAGLASAAAPFILAEVDISAGSFLAAWVIPPLAALAMACWGWALAREAGADIKRQTGAALAGGLAGLALWPILVHDCYGGAWTPIGPAAMAASVAFVPWALSRGSGTRSAPEWRPFTLFAVMMIFPWFIWGWHGQAGRFFPYDDLSDSLTYQVFAREIFVEGDWLHAMGEPVIFYQPGYRYVAGMLHTIFGQSFLAQNILELWSMPLTCFALAVIGRWAGVGRAASAIAGFAYLTLLFGPHYMVHVGLGMQELTANIFFFGTIILIAYSRGGAPLTALAGVLAAAAFWMRFDRLGALAAAVVFMTPPAIGPAREAWGRLLSEFAEKWRPVAIYLAILSAGVALVFARNWAFGGQAALLYRDNMTALTCKSLECSLRAYRQILAGSVSCFDRSGAVMIPAVAFALAAMAARPGWLRAIPVSLGLFILGLLSPYYFGGPTNFEPKFSMHLLPLACISLVAALHSILAPRKP